MIHVCTDAKDDTVMASDLAVRSLFSLAAAWFANAPDDSFIAGFNANKA